VLEQWVWNIYTLHTKDLLPLCKYVEGNFFNMMYEDCSANAFLYLCFLYFGLLAYMANWCI